MEEFYNSLPYLILAAILVVPSFQYLLNQQELELMLADRSKMEKKDLQKEDLFKKLRQSLKTEPSKWKLKRYTIKHKEWEIELWISKGRDSLEVYRPSKIEFSKKERACLYNLIEQIKVDRCLNDTVI